MAQHGSGLSHRMNIGQRKTSNVRNVFRCEPCSLLFEEARQLQYHVFTSVHLR